MSVRHSAPVGFDAIGYRCGKFAYDPNPKHLCIRVPTLDTERRNSYWGELRLVVDAPLFQTIFSESIQLV